MNFNAFTFLLVEDTDLSAMIVSRFLEQEGAVVNRVQNGQEAIDALDNQSFDVILMDIHMPILNGIETTKILRDNGYEKTILLMTAHEEKDLDDSVVSMGFDGFVQKPTSSSKFIEDISNALSKA